MYSSYRVRALPDLRALTRQSRFVSGALEIEPFAAVLLNSVESHACILAGATAALFARVGTIARSKREGDAMDFGLNEDQETLAKYARDFLTNECPTSFVRQMMESDTAHDAGFYSHMG